MNMQVEVSLMHPTEAVPLKVVFDGGIAKEGNLG